MNAFVEEFKAFAMKGNVIDLAVAVVIGAAFGKIVSSLVEDIVMPVIGLLLGGIDFSGLSYTLGGAIVSYGAFIQSIVDFLIVAVAIFMVVKVINKKETQVPDKTKSAEIMPVGPSEEILLLREIRDTIRR